MEMSVQHWMSWEGGVDLIGMTCPELEMPNVIVHVARMVHTPVGSAPAGMLFYQPDPLAAPEIFGFVSSSAEVGAYFRSHLFVGTPFENASVIVGSIAIEISPEHATARVEIPGFTIKTHLAEFSPASLVARAPQTCAPFEQRGIEAVAGHSCLKINGEKVDLTVPAIGMSGGPSAVLAACGIYAR